MVEIFLTIFFRCVFDVRQSLNLVVRIHLKEPPQALDTPHTHTLTVIDRARTDKFVLGWIIKNQ